MKNNNIFHSITMIISLTVLLSSCEEFLEAKPEKSIVTPTTLEDFRAVLDNVVTALNFTPALGVISGDDTFLDDEGFTGLSLWQKNCYLWQRPVFDQTMVLSDWSSCYEGILYANVVLEGIAKTGGGLPEYSTLRGEALFHRAFAYFQLLQFFAPAYDPAGDNLGPAVPLRLSPAVHQDLERASVSDCYAQMVTDLGDAAALLEDRSSPASRPSRQAALALLSRIHLVMGNYDKAREEARNALNIYDRLLDYSSLDLDGGNPFSEFNDEVIFYARMLDYGYFDSQVHRVDTLLYNAYDEDDLRKRAFFSVRELGNINFTGSYTGSNDYFSGLAVPELLLTIAETSVRMGDPAGAERALGTLLKSRYRPGAIVPSGLEGLGTREMLQKVLSERRKEMVLRGMRWSDLKRLNKDPATAKVLEKKIEGKIYRLEPDDEKYVLPIPPRETELDGI
ncbi:RagB/SusD family nutrient uptake outer membrane protein [Echinicola soli]|nr:RagB/SusD family nutrient uptake outer membrane protein [Echinicola soli]